MTGGLNFVALALKGAGSWVARRVMLKVLFEIWLWLVSDAQSIGRMKVISIPFSPTVTRYLSCQELASREGFTTDDNSSRAPASPWREMGYGSREQQARHLAFTSSQAAAH